MSTPEERMAEAAREALERAARTIKPEDEAEGEDEHTRARKEDQDDTVVVRRRRRPSGGRDDDR